MASGDEKPYGSARYHGMKVGGVHHWTYPDGKWTERKVAPDRWELAFTSLKRRDRQAPTGSGTEVGSGYHWLVVAHQWVDKLDANTYATQMEGSKYLLAFRKPDWPVWSTQLRGSRRHAKEKAIAALRDMIRRLEASEEDFEDVVDQAALVELAARLQLEAGEREAEEKTAAWPGRPRGARPGRGAGKLTTGSSAAGRKRSRPRRKRRAARRQATALR